jgi:hypothetical protein
MPFPYKIKGDQYAHLITGHWYYSGRFVGARSSLSPYFWRVSPYSTYYCSHSHNYLADKGGILSLLGIPAFMTSSRIMVLPFEFIDTGCGIQNLIRLSD